MSNLKLGELACNYRLCLSEKIQCSDSWVWLPYSTFNQSSHTRVTSPLCTSAQPGAGDNQRFLMEGVLLHLPHPFNLKTKNPNPTHTSPSKTAPVHTTISQHWKGFHGIWWPWEISWPRSTSHRISTHFINTHWILISCISVGNFCCKGVLCACFGNSSSEPNLSNGIALVTWNRYL